MTLGLIYETGSLSFQN